MSEENRLQQQRTQKRDALRAMGVDPYGSRFDGVQSTASVRAVLSAANAS